MREFMGRRRRNAMGSAAAAAGGAGAVAGLIDCHVCGAPNGAHREGCFNCGSLLASAEGAAGADMERLAVGGDDEPGRVVYVLE